MRPRVFQEADRLPGWELGSWATDILWGFLPLERGGPDNLLRMGSQGSGPHEV